MSGAHGGGLRACFAASERPMEAGPETVAPLDLRGYRHFLGAPTRRHGDAATDRSPAAVRRRLSGLSLAMQTTDPVEGQENPGIPSGYTYLLQLVAHDCVRTTTPLWALTPFLNESQNMRAARLRLDTVYGDGPNGCPYAYAPDDEEDLTRTRLRLGMPAPRGAPMSPTPFRDVARARADGALGEPATGRAEPLLPDPRNDDNALISQMTALFHQLHNALVLKLPPMRARRGDEAALLKEAEARFNVARLGTTMIYRRVVRDDALRRILDPGIYARYAAGDAALLDRDALHQRGEAVPLEFSHGAFRFAHAMIRPTYTISDMLEADVDEALRLTCGRSPKKMPLSQDWIVRWGNFFDLADAREEGAARGANGRPARRNLSLRIMPRYNRNLRDSSLFPRPEADGDEGVGYRDLISASAAGLWSVPALYGRMRQVLARRGQPDPFEQSPLADDRVREEAISDWLRARPHSGLAGEDIRALASDPPIPYYAMFEAEREGDGGRRLGPFASLIIADVLFGALWEDPLPGEVRGESLAEGLGKLCAAVLGDRGALRAVPEIGDMAGLIHFVAAAHDLRDASPAFL
ncbi:hypothetical protein [Muricoccus radiodurans]|uniref:hypothetical protein n=1 Tax=Muricoccus radiodurans TaxID=2231721 RepID=UPI003CF69F5C